MDSEQPQVDTAAADLTSPLLWRQSQSEEAAEAHFSAALRTRPDTPFATITRCHQPAGMWMLTMFPHGRHRQFVVYFPSLDAARRAVETWARHDDPASASRASGQAVSAARRADPDEEDAAE